MKRFMAPKEKFWRVYRLFRAYLSRIYELSETHPRSTYRAIFSLEFIVVVGICLAGAVGLIAGSIKGVEIMIRTTAEALSR